MDPIVTAAAIGVAGTVIVGVAGFGAAAWTAHRSVAVAREDRLWDRRSEVYCDVLAAINWRQAKRNVDIRAIDGSGLDPVGAQQLLASYKRPDWHMLGARQQAFGSAPVFTATQASSRADILFVLARQRWQQQPSADAKAAVAQAMQAADDAE